jgi:CHAT domain-containing protein/predicted negative regulator of RcsB-dependent stress response
MYYLVLRIRLASISVFKMIFLLFLLAVLPLFGLAQKIDEPQTLSLTQAIQRELKGDETHSYNLFLSAGQYLHIVVDQRGIDVVVALFSPNGYKLTEVDSPNGTQGPEPVFIIAETSGTYRLEVRALEKAALAGHYEVKIEELRTATGRDKSHITAERSFKEAELLRAEETDTSRQRAIKKYEEALPLYRAVGDRSGEAKTINNIGLVYSFLGEKQKALGYYNQALSLRRAAGDLSGEASTLSGITSVYDSLGEKQKAIDHYGQALQVYQGLGDRGNEGATLYNISLVYAGTGQNQKALECLLQAMPLYHATGSLSGEAMTLYMIGSISDGLGEKQKALEYYKQALSHFQAVGAHASEATTHYRIGSVYTSLGENQKALGFYSQALQLYQAGGDHKNEASVLCLIGATNYGLGEKQKALDSFNQALPLLRAVNDRSSEAATLEYIGLVYDSLSEWQKAIDHYGQALRLYQGLGDRAREALLLSSIGRTYNSLGEKQRALDYLNQALPLLRAVGERRGEASALYTIGSINDDLGEKQKALGYLNQAAPLHHALGDREGEAMCLGMMGLIYEALGERQKALDHYAQARLLHRAIGDRFGEMLMLNRISSIIDDLDEQRKTLEYFMQALPSARAAGDHMYEALILQGIGKMYVSLGEKQKALDYYAQSLTLFRALGERDAEAEALSMIGSINYGLDERQKAIEHYNESVLLYHAAGNREGEGRALSDIGLIYNDLGERQKALDYFNQSLSLLHAVGNRDGEAKTLNNMGLVYHALGEQQKALDYYNQALPLFRAVEDRSSEGRTLGNIGRVYLDLNEKQKALDYYNQALPLLQAVGDRSAEAHTLDDIGTVYWALDEKQKSLNYHAQALPLLRAVNDRSGEATTLGHLMFIHWSLNNMGLAIFYGKQSINILQLLRSNVQGLDKEVQKSFLRVVEPPYRALTESLIAQGRYAEALQVINAFKDQQFFDFDQTQPKQATPLARTPHEDELRLRYEKSGDDLGVLGGQITELQRKLRGRQPNADEAVQLQQLGDRLKEASDAFSGFLKQAEAEFSKPADEKDKPGEAPDLTHMQAALLQLSKETNQKAAAIYTLIGQEKFHVLIVTAEDIAAVSTPIKGDELSARARQLWALLQSADYDPRALSNELYNIIFKPIEGRLPKDTKTLLWSLDGNLRYLPMAALYDGKQYLVERFSHVVFTRAENERLTRAVSATWQGSGFATSAPHKVVIGGKSIEFSSLDFVKDEMQIFRTQSNPNGIIAGEVFPDAQFNKAALLAALKQKRPLVHISSHFRFRPGDEANSFLLLGDGSVLTVAEMKGQSDLFQGVELLTLSACDTAAQRPDANGREIDTLAELAQRLGAASVLASLWPVRDRSTAQLMKAFYKNREGGKATKAEALRKAQLDLLYGNSRIVNQGSEALLRGSSTDEEIIVEAKYRVPFKPEKSRPFAHPYYWSPFVLFGNWR